MIQSVRQLISHQDYSQDPVDVLLTYPSDGLRLFQSMIPIGVVNIGTVLQQAGYRVKIIDFNHYQRDFRRDLASLKPRIVGIGGTTPSRQGSFLTARLVKEILPSSLVVYGGVHASFAAEDTLLYQPEVDAVLRGEGELAFLELVQSVWQNQSWTHVPGLVYRSPQGIVKNPKCRIDDLSVLPMADRDLVQGNYDMEMEFLGGPGDFIMTSRGCPAACNFCAAARMFPGGVRTRPMDQVMTEVDYLLGRQNLTGLKIFDSTFTANREHVESFCQEIKSFDLPWECELRADTVDRDLLQLMRESGCYYVNMGMETSNPEQLKKISKGITPDQVLHVLDDCRDLGIRSKVFFTFGHMGQTFTQAKTDVEFIRKHRTSIDFFGVSVGMRIYPGTSLEKKAAKAGLLPKGFHWGRSAKEWPGGLRNLLVLEPSDVPILFQKQLGAVHLLYLIVVLFFQGLICTKGFLIRMAWENVQLAGAAVRQQLRYTWQRIGRMLRPVQVT